MIDAFRVFSNFTTGNVYAMNFSGQLPKADDRICQRNIRSEPIDISQIPDISEIKNYEDN